jgi:hypothetical protein
LISYPVDYGQTDKPPHSASKSFLGQHYKDFVPTLLSSTLVQNYQTEFGEDHDADVFPIDEVSATLSEFMQKSTSYETIPKDCVIGLWGFLCLIRINNLIPISNGSFEKNKRENDFSLKFEEVFGADPRNDFTWLYNSVLTTNYQDTFPELIRLIAQYYFAIVDYPLETFHFEIGGLPFPNLDREKFINYTFSEGLVGNYYLESEAFERPYSPDAFLASASAEALVSALDGLPIPVSEDRTSQLFENLYSHLQSSLQLFENCQLFRTFALFKDKGIYDVENQSWFELTSIEKKIFRIILESGGIKNKDVPTGGEEDSARKSFERLRNKLKKMCGIELITEISNGERPKTYGINTTCRLLVLENCEPAKIYVRLDS